MIGLEERRDALQRELGDLVHKLGGLRDAIVSETGSAFSAVTSTLTGGPRRRQRRSAKSPSPRKGRRRATRGSLREKVLAELQSAGRGGVTVQELADKLGTKPVNIHSWIHSTGKGVAGLKKVGRGRYALLGSATSTGGATASSNGGARKVSTKSAAPRRGAARGALSERILSAMKGSGSRGISLKDLSEKTGAPYKNLSIWFSTTGKKNSGIKKVSPGVYKLTA